jgi:hypothetical protein
MYFFVPQISNILRIFWQINNFPRFLPPPALGKSINSVVAGVVHMPGHVKRGGAGDPDPDPAPYLFISYEEKQKGGHT